jgi:hypothetical protein
MDIMKLQTSRRLGLALLFAGVVWGLWASESTLVAQPAQSTSALGELVSMRMHTILLSDDDGSRAAQITRTEISELVEFANRIFAAANVRVEFDASESSMDISTMRSTLLNSMDPPVGRDHPAVLAGKAIAAQRPGVITVFFRHGPGPSPTGWGFYAGGSDFIAMPIRRQRPSPCAENIDIFAHELGHYLGLPHTFAQKFDSISAAETYFAGKNRDPLAFDGDGLPDTLSDPYVDRLEFACTAVDTVTVLGVAFPLPRWNIMSYYKDIAAVENRTISAMQAIITRQVFLLTAGQLLQKILEGEGPALIEAETLAYTATAGRPRIQDMKRLEPRWWSGGAQILWSDGSVRDRLTMKFPVETAGRYEIYLGATRSFDFGTFQHYVDDAVAGTPVDLYGPRPIPSGPISLGTFQLEAGTHSLSAEIVGTNALALQGKAFYGIDYILLKRRD